MKIRHVREQARPFEFTPEERVHLEGMTDEQVEAAARADPDNPPLDEARLARLASPARIRQTRERLGLSQPEFARRFRFSVGRLRDLEQGRTRADGVVTAYLRLIEADPEFVRRTLDAA